jgi:hypothetical protein
MLRRAFSISQSLSPDGNARSPLRSIWRNLFTSAWPHEDIRRLPPYLLRDIGLSEHHMPDWERDLR